MDRTTLAASELAEVLDGVHPHVVIALVLLAHEVARHPGGGEAVEDAARARLRAAVLEDSMLGRGLDPAEALDVAGETFDVLTTGTHEQIAQILTEPTGRFGALRAVLPTGDPQLTADLLAAAERRQGSHDPLAPVEAVATTG